MIKIVTACRESRIGSGVTLWGPQKFRSLPSSTRVPTPTTHLKGQDCRAVFRATVPEQDKLLQGRDSGGSDRHPGARMNPGLLPVLLFCPSGVGEGEDPGLTSLRSLTFYRVVAAPGSAYRRRFRCPEAPTWRLHRRWQRSQWWRLRGGARGLPPPEGAAPSVAAGRPGKLRVCES